MTNDVLMLKFFGLCETVVDNVNAADIVDFLYQERILEIDDFKWLQQQKDRYQQCRNLLMLLQQSGNRQAFVKLYGAIKDKPQLQWLIERIDEYSDQSLIVLQSQQRYTSDKTGRPTAYSCHLPYLSPITHAVHRPSLYAL